MGCDKVQTDMMKVKMSKYNKVYKRKKERSELLSILVPRPGIEPGWIAPLVFETSASTDSAIWAFAVAKVLIIFELTNFLGTFFSKNAFLMQKH